MITSILKLCLRFLETIPDDHYLCIYLNFKRTKLVLCQFTERINLNILAKYSLKGTKLGNFPHFLGRVQRIILLYSINIKSNPLILLE